MKRIVINLSPLILFCLLVDCNSITDTEYDNQFNICSVLRADSISYALDQWVKVDQTYKMNERSEPWIDDATVLLSYRTRLDTLVYTHDGFYYYYWNFKPLDTVSITVLKPGLDTLFGSTIIPGPISVMHPSHNDTVSFSDSIILRICDNGAMYYGYGKHHDAIHARLEAYYLPEENDTLIIIPLQGFGDYLGAGYFYFQFAVFDSNYYNYFIDNDSIVCAGVTGGIGLFGSSYTTEICFELVE